ncbi:MAG: hypothetical protein QW291_08655 [Thermofilaceae archaeon]
MGSEVLPFINLRKAFYVTARGKVAGSPLNLPSSLRALPLRVMI